MKLTRNTLRSVTRVLLVTALAVAGVLFAPANAAAQTNTPPRGRAAFEVRFLEDIIDQDAAVLARTALVTNRAVHPELEALSQSIATNETAQIEQLQALLQDLYGITYEPRTRPGDARLLQRLASASGTRFEIQFMRLLVQSDAFTLVRANQARRNAFHPEVRAISDTILTTNSADILQLRQRLCQWYDFCNSGPVLFGGTRQ